MGCDIHLKLERRLKKEKVWNKYYTEKCEWKPCKNYPYDKTWGNRIYGMFAALADVRNYSDWNIKPLPIRGMPEDACDNTLKCYGYQVVDKIEYEWQEDTCVLASDAEKWVKDGWSEYFEIDGTKYVSGPDWHSPNWCTTQEMEDCINQVFKDENGNWKSTGEPYEWLALLGAMKGYEATGEYECRAVFWFDN